MAKIERGRLDGVWGMGKFTADDIHGMADAYEADLIDPRNTDDPSWIRRRIAKLRRLASRKEKSLEHKRSDSPPA
jgi:hypothetical protein